MRIKVIQAAYGDCLLVESTSKGRRPTRILIDGGADDSFSAHLKPVLERIGGRRILDAVVLSHVDNDHVDGLLDLVAYLEDHAGDGSRSLGEIRDFWMNEFDVSGAAPTGTAPPGVMQSIANGTELKRGVDRLRLPINRQFGGSSILVPDVGPFRMGPLEITVVGPSEEMLERLRRDWVKWLWERSAAPADALADWDTSVPNRSSVMLHVRQGRRTVLLPGDGRSDHMIEGLEVAGLIPAGRSLHVDLFKLPHHGSARNVDAETLRRITADTYVLSADGKHGNPDYQTLVWLAESIRARAGRALLFFTNRTRSLDRILQSHPPATFGYRTEVMGGDEHFRELAVGPGP